MQTNEETTREKTETGDARVMVQPPRHINFYHLPVIILLPTALLPIICCLQLDGDSAFRFMMSIAGPFLLATAVGSVLLFVVLLVFITGFLKSRIFSGIKFAWLVLGFLSHPFVLGRIMQFFEWLMNPPRR